MQAVTIRAGCILGNQLRDWGVGESKVGRWDLPPGFGDGGGWGWGVGGWLVGWQTVHVAPKRQYPP